MKTRIADTPIGKLLLCESKGKICRAEFVIENRWNQSDDSALLDEAVRQIEAYFSGKLKQFQLPIAIEGTEFEQEVLNVLLEIPYGQTIAYSEIARLLGKKNGARAVGRACARNPLLVLVPCHRVIARNGKLTGFAAGVERKQALLLLEQKYST